jgi:uncharacterized membrane protein
MRRRGETMGNLYLWMKVLHVLTAIWVSVSAFGGTVLRAAVKRAPDFPARIAVLRAGVRFGLIFGFGGGITVGVTGLTLLALDPAWRHDTWVHASIGLWLLMLLLNLLLIGPRMRKLLAAGEASLAAGDAPNEEFRKLAANPVPAWLANLPPLAILIFVILMVLKPS